MPGVHPLLNSPHAQTSLCENLFYHGEIWGRVTRAVRENTRCGYGTSSPGRLKLPRNQTVGSSTRLLEGGAYMRRFVENERESGLSYCVEA